MTRKKFLLIALVGTLILLTIFHFVSKKQEIDGNGKWRNGYKTYEYSDEYLVISPGPLLAAQRMLHDSNKDTVPDYAMVHEMPAPHPDPLTRKDTLDFKKAFKK